MEEWADERRVTRLKSLWQSGLSAGDIMALLNREFGSAFTRSAVIGKITRLRLPPRDPRLLTPMQKKSSPRARAVSAPAAADPPPAVQLRRSETPIRLPAARRAEHSKSHAAENDAPSVSPAPCADEPMPTAGLQLLELTNATCRWPFGDPCSGRFYFCGTAEADLDQNRPYCRLHMLKAIDPEYRARAAKRMRDREPQENRL